MNNLKKPLKSRHGVYIASKTVHAPRWRELRAQGLPVTSTWIDEAGVGETVSFPDLWRRCVSEASNAACLIAYREPGETLKGGLIEIGAALGAGVPVLLIGFAEPNFSFKHHPLANSVPSLESALAFARAYLNGV